MGFGSAQFSHSSHVWLFVIAWTIARQASLSITNSQSLLKLMSIELVMPSNHLIFCRPLLLLPSIFPSIRVFSSESVLHIRWPKYWSFSFSISPSNENSGLISFRMDWLDLLAVPRTLREHHSGVGTTFTVWWWGMLAGPLWRTSTGQHAQCGLCSWHPLHSLTHWTPHGGSQKFGKQLEPRL